MARDTKENSPMINVKAMVHSFGLMDASILASGSVESSTEMVPIIAKRVLPKKASGIMAVSSDGSMKMNEKSLCIKLLS